MKVTICANVGLDCYGDYHWWIYYNDGVHKEHIDMTSKQYYIENVPCPSDDKHGIGIANKLPYSSIRRELNDLRTRWSNTRHHKITGRDQNGGKTPQTPMSVRKVVKDNLRKAVLWVQTRPSRSLEPHRQDPDQEHGDT